MEFFEYFSSTVPQQYATLLLAATALAALYVLTGPTSERFQADTPCALVRLGAIPYITAQLMQAGAYCQASQIAATTDGDLEAWLVEFRIVDAVDDALEIGAYTTLGLGIVSLAITTWHHPDGETLGSSPWRQERCTSGVECLVVPVGASARWPPRPHQILLGRVGFEVELELFPDGVVDAPFPCSAAFLLGLALGDLAVEEPASGSLVADLGDRSDADRPVQPTAPRP
jgi:hypothetical protein